MTASATVSRRKVLFLSAVREGLFSSLCGHERGGLLWQFIQIVCPRASHPAAAVAAAACVRAVRAHRGYGGMPEVDLGDPACPSPEPTARVAGGRAAVMPAVGRAGKRRCSAVAVQ